MKGVLRDVVRSKVPFFECSIFKHNHNIFIQETKNYFIIVRKRNKLLYIKSSVVIFRVKRPRDIKGEDYI